MPDCVGHVKLNLAAGAGFFFSSFFPLGEGGLFYAMHLFFQI